MLSLFRLAVVCTLLAIGGCQGMPPKTPASIAKGDYVAVRCYLTQRIAYDMRTLDVPALSIALVDDQQLVWSAGFGDADAKHRRITSGDTLYRVGAISKVFTAAGVMRAADESTLSLDVAASMATTAMVMLHQAKAGALP